MFSRKFTLRHTFEKISALQLKNGPIETHFGIPWCIYLVKSDDHLEFHLSCERKEDAKNPWSVSTQVTLRMQNGNQHEKVEKSLKAEYQDNFYLGFEKFYKWSDVIEKYVVDNKLTVEIDVIIEEIKGIIPKRKRNFEEPKENMTDVVLMVGDHKFHVSKVILAEFSDFFKPLFFNGCKETNQSEITLKAVNPAVFQMVLEVIYGKAQCIQEVTVEDILHLARQYQMEFVTSRCEEFMIHNEEVSEHLKFRLASEYKLHNLQDHLVKTVKTIVEADEIFKNNFKYMDKDFCMKVLQNVYN